MAYAKNVFVPQIQLRKNYTLKVLVKEHKFVF